MTTPNYLKGKGYKRAMAKFSQAKGECGEEFFKPILTRMGLRMAKKIHTPYKLLYFGKLLKSAFPLEKVEGDIRGILDGGRSVLAECKFYDEKLLFSCLKAHQFRALGEHYVHGGLSLLCWRWNNGHSIMRWPVPGFLPGTSLSTVRALELHVATL